jgi:hypothetical protein
MKYVLDFKMYLFISAFIISVFLVYFSTTAPKESFLDRLLSKINAISVVYIAVGIYITFEIFNQTTDEMRRQTTLKIIDRSLLGNVKLIIENYNKCPKFASSLFYSWQKPASFKEPEGEDDWTTVIMISFNIFQAFEDILTVSDVDQTGLYVWLANFMPWCRSKYLRKAWDQLYPNYADRTVLFGNLLFNTFYDKPEPKNSEEYKILARNLVESKDFKYVLSYDDK